MAVTPVPLIHIRWHDTAVVILLGCPLDLVVLHVYGVSINLSPHFQAPFLGQDRSPAPFGSRQPVGQGGVTLNLLIASLQVLNIACDIHIAIHLLSSFLKRVDQPTAVIVELDNGCSVC